VRARRPGRDQLLRPGAGFLTGKYRSEADLSKSPRGPGVKDLAFNERGWRVLAALDAVAARTGATVAQVALAWQMRQPGIVAPIASATSLAQWQELAAAATLHLLDRVPQQPGVAEGVAHAAAAFAVELVGGRHLQRGTQRHHAGGQRVAVVHVQVDAGAHHLARTGREQAVFREGLAEHQHQGAQHQLGMADAARGFDQAQPLGGTKGLAVEVDGPRGAVDAQVGKGFVDDHGRAAGCGGNHSVARRPGGGLGRSFSR
jgi:hypothetical protein